MDGIAFIYATELEAQSACFVWQHILGLRDWDVRVLFQDIEDLPPDAMASANIQLEKRQARINLITPSTYHAGKSTHLWPLDHERSLVHELLHLHFFPFAPKDANSPEGIAEEQAIHAISLALLSLRRTGEGVDA